ncbi:uncharacterized protein PHALS_13647 [Plasmopara halstedii]|uniref:Uncharacterized protein n=1 Tax=Plasmopara halstedii TaxID=4781 RepID=A0A0P1AQ63_PLAHL|nr:uncharacterized protein PHALS_13647 [Plasmopara halstedii]CEG43452.1 hypothetical protein PHALS_13647 [Plasmopara halstedii]|eukprot:XP_024579821.1 hypothetical protein PHALS_13647 [Plasmopara halstedii]
MIDELFEVEPFTDNITHFMFFSPMHELRTPYLLLTATIVSILRHGFCDIIQPVDNGMNMGQKKC